MLYACVRSVLPARRKSAPSTSLPRRQSKSKPCCWPLAAAALYDRSARARTQFPPRTWPPRESSPCSRARRPSALPPHAARALHTILPAAQAGLRGPCSPPSMLGTQSHSKLIGQLMVVKCYQSSSLLLKNELMGISKLFCAMS